MSVENFLTNKHVKLFSLLLFFISRLNLSNNKINLYFCWLFYFIRFEILRECGEFHLLYARFLFRTLLLVIMNDLEVTCIKREVSTFDVSRNLLYWLTILHFLLWNSILHLLYEAGPASSDDEERLIIDKFRTYNHLIRPVEGVNASPIVVHFGMAMILLINVVYNFQCA